MAENWFRWHVGTVNDPKWKVISKRSGQPIHVVLAVWASMLETACNAMKRHETPETCGNMDGWNSEDQAAALDLDPSQIDAVYTAMQGKVLNGSRIISWRKRQPKREDNSTDRVREHRERKASESDDGNAMKRHETHGNARGEEIREEKNTSPLRVDVTREGSDFAVWWSAYPHKIGKAAAAKSFMKAMKLSDLKSLLSGIDRYIATKPPDRDWCNPATWLNQARWLDEPGAAKSAAAPNLRYSNSSLARSLLQEIEHDHDRASPSRNGVGVHGAQDAGKRGAGPGLSTAYLRLAGPDETER